MKKWIVMLLALLAFTVLPSSGTELGELRPVSLLSDVDETTPLQMLNYSEERYFLEK